MVDVAEAVGGVQSQMRSAAGLSLNARLDGLRAPDVERAILRTRRLARAWCMRRTLYLLPSDSLGIFLRGTVRRAERETRWLHHRGIPERTIRRMAEAILESLGEPRTRAEFTPEVARALGTKVTSRSWGGWGGTSTVPALKLGGLALPSVWLLHIVAAYGCVCYGPDRDGHPTFVRADRWVPGWRDWKVPEAERELLRRYLRAFGPSTPEDFAWWTGLLLRDSREIWSSLAGEIAPLEVDGWPAGVLTSDLADLKERREEELPVRLLPYFDTLLLGHRERGHLIENEHLGTVYRPQGWIYPVVLDGGRVVAVWTHEVRKGRVDLRVEPHQTLTDTVRRGIRDEAEHLAFHLGGEVGRIDYRPSGRPGQKGPQVSGGWGRQRVHA